MYLYVITLVIFILLGLITGSFLNVLIYRLENKKRKTLFGRSFCPSCGQQIAWYDNIPIISWLVLGGKCRKCGKQISSQYPLVELATGFLFAAIGLKFLFLGALHIGIDSGQARMTAPDILNLLFWLFFTAGLIVIFVYDFKHQIIPNEIIYTLLAAGLVFVGVDTLFFGGYQYLIDHLLSGLLAGGFFYALAAVSKGKWMGGGDIKLVAFMGLVLGWQGLLAALYFSFVLGAVFGLSALVAHKKALSSRIPFGPFLVAGTFVGLFFGEQMVSFYVRMFL